MRLNLDCDSSMWWGGRHGQAVATAFGLVALLGLGSMAGAQTVGQKGPDRVLPATKGVTQSWATMVRRDAQVQREIAVGARIAPTPVVAIPFQSDGVSLSDSSVFVAPPKAGLLGGPKAPQGIGLGWEGISLQDQLDAFSSASVPPDTMGAVGPNHFVECLRGSVAVYGKTGTRASHVSLSSFFAVTGGYPRGGAIYPRILFDRMTGRWFASAVEVNGGSNNHIILAVSATSDPTGTWTKFVIPVGVSGYMTDYGTLGVDQNGVYFGAYMASAVAGSYGIMVATRKSLLLAGTPSLGTVYVFNTRDLSNVVDMYAAPQPAVNFDTVRVPDVNGPSDYAWFVAAPATGLANVCYRKLQWSKTWVPTCDKASTVVTTPAFGAVVDAPALGSTTNVACNDHRLLGATIRANKLWLTRNVGVNANGGASSPDRTAAEWLQVAIDQTTGGAALNMSGRVFDGGATNPMSYYYPSVMVSGQGHAALGFSGSSAASYISAFTCGRLASDAAGTMRAIATVRAGVSDYTRLDGGKNRWGNYSYTSLDPNDDQTLWTVQSYASASNANPSNVWGTYIQQLLAPAPTLNNPGFSVVAGNVGVILNLTGTNFWDPGAGFANHIAAQLLGGSPNGISNVVTTYNSSTSAKVVFDSDEWAEPGVRDVKIINPDGQSATIAGGVTLIAPTATTLAVSNKSAQIYSTLSLEATLTNTATGAAIAGKTVTFKVDGTTIGTGTTDASGIATKSYTVAGGTTLGDHTIDAKFVFDGTNHTATGTGTLTVTKADTTTTVAAAAGAIGDTVALKANVKRNPDSAPVAGVTVDLWVAGASVGSATTDASGNVSVNYTIPEGTGARVDPIEVGFTGDAQYNSSVGINDLTVSTANVTVATAAVAGIADDNATLKATLTRTVDAAPLAGRTLTFKVDGAVAGTGTTDASGVATVTYWILAGTTVGSHAVTADFAGDTWYNSATNNGSLTVSANTNVITGSASGQIGATVNLTATLKRTDDSSTLAGKTVTFSVAGTVVGTGVTSATGVATYAYKIAEGAGVGARGISAAFAGDSNYNASSGSGTLTVLITATKISAGAASGSIGATVSLYAYLQRNTDSSTIVGKTLTFSVDGTVVGTGTTDATGKATKSYKIPEVATGAHVIKVDYAGDSNYLSSTKTSTLTVNKAGVSFYVNSLSARRTYTVALYCYLRRATDSALLAGRTVTCKVDGVAVGSATTDASGKGSVNYTVPSSSTIADHTITWEFAGDASYNAGSGTGTLTVVYIPTYLYNASVAGRTGDLVQLYAYLWTGVSPDKVMQSGKSVRFSIDGTVVGSATTDVNGKAALSYRIAADLTSGGHVILAEFLGNQTLMPSTKTATLTVTMLIGTKLYCGPASGAAGSTVTLYGYLSNAVDGTVISGKTVTFTVNGVAAGSGVTSSTGYVSVRYTVPAGTPSGTLPIANAFAGDATYGASTGSSKLTVP